MNTEGDKMKEIIKTKLPPSKIPFEWAVSANGTLYTAQIPINEKGELVGPDIKEQAKAVMENLKHTLKAAGLSMDSILQMLIYVTKPEYLPIFNEIYKEYFDKSYPNRAAMVVAALAREGMLIELVVYANTN